MDEAINNTLKDVEKLEEQILSILAALKNEGSIEEAHLLPIPLIPGLDAGKNGNETEVGIADEGKKRRGKAKTLTASQLKSKKMQIDSAPVPMDISVLEDVPKFQGFNRTQYTLIESSVFLLPVMDTWVFGMTLVNSSLVPQNQPELILSVIPKETDVINKPCCVFNYSFQITPLDVKQESMEIRNVSNGIPYHDTFVPNEVGNEGAQPKIQPGCQVLVTATFGHPLGFCGISNDFNLIISLSVDGIQILAKTIPASSSSHCMTELNDNVFRIHRVSILTALSRHREFFKMRRLLSHGDKSPHKAIEKFLIPLGFEKIFSESVGIDTSVEYFASGQMAMLWGLIFKIERCFRNVNEIRCVVGARSEQQMQIFAKIFCEWLKKECQHERNKGLKGISVVSSLPSNENKGMIKTLKSEIQALTELMQLFKTGNFRSASSQMDRDWINRFSHCLSATDSIFMQYMKNIT